METLFTLRSRSGMIIASTYMQYSENTPEVDRWKEQQINEMEAEWN